MKTQEVRWVLDGEEPFDDSRDGVVRFFTVPGDTDVIDRATAGLRLDSSVDLTLPSTDIDSEDVYNAQIAFYVGERPLVALTGGNSIPRSVVTQAVERIAGDLVDLDSKPTEFKDHGDDARWVIVSILRKRIGRIEEAVLSALADDNFSSSDYEALREYPGRLSKVARLASELPDLNGGLTGKRGSITSLSQVPTSTGGTYRMWGMTHGTRSHDCLP